VNQSELASALGVVVDQVLSPYQNTNVPPRMTTFHNDGSSDSGDTSDPETLVNPSPIIRNSMIDPSIRELAHHLQLISEDEQNPELKQAKMMTVSLIAALEVLQRRQNVANSNIA
jgi:hypothetical protein